MTFIKQKQKVEIWNMKCLKIKKHPQNDYIAHVLKEVKDHTENSHTAVHFTDTPPKQQVSSILNRCVGHSVLWVSGWDIYTRVEIVIAHFILFISYGRPITKGKC